MNQKPDRLTTKSTQSRLRIYISIEIESKENTKATQSSDTQSYLPL
jgi:hypothetical protein